jgi:hypothetical protein
MNNNMILEITKKMSLALTDDAWDSFVELQDQRQTLIDDFFSKSQLNKSSENIFKKMLQMDKEIIRQLEQGKQEILLKTREISLSRRAIMTYKVCNRIVR